MANARKDAHGKEEKHSWWRQGWGTAIVLVGTTVGLVALGVFASAFEDLKWKGWFALAVVVLLLVGLIHEAAPTHVLFAIALGVLVVFQCVDSAGALAGFSNRGISTIAVLYIVAAATTRTNSLALLFRWILDAHKKPSLRAVLAKLCLPLGAVSMFLNSTPIYVASLPVLIRISKATEIAPSKIMMPVSISLILGGTLSLIGNMNNLLVAGLAEADPDLLDKEGQPLQFEFFGLSKVGSLYFAFGLAYVWLLAPWERMLPTRQGTETIVENARQYLVHLKVTPGARTIVQHTVETSGLGSLKTNVLMEIHRGEEVLPAPGLDVVILEGDILVFTGQLNTVLDIYRQDGGLRPLGEDQEGLDSSRLHSNLYEAAVSRDSLLLVGNKICNVCFRDRFQAAVLAVTPHHGSEVINGKLGDHVLEGGDTLLVEAKPRFYRDCAPDRNFSTVFPVEGSSPPVDDWFHIIASTVILAAVVAIPPTGVVGIWVTATGGSLLMVATRCINLRDAESSIDIPLMLTIAFSFGVGSAVQQTGVGEAIANLMVGWLQPLGPIGFLSAIYISVGLLTEIITNSGAIALFFPIVSGILKDKNVVGLSPYASCYVLMLAGSASFITPIGHQLNLMAHAAGGYEYLDWLRFGLPLQVLLALVGITGCYFFYPA